MEARITRASAAQQQETTSLSTVSVQPGQTGQEQQQQLSTPFATPTKKKKAPDPDVGRRSSVDALQGGVPLTPESSRKRKRKDSIVEADVNELLPHNLGRRIIAVSRSRASQHRRTVIAEDNPPAKKPSSLPRTNEKQIADSVLIEKTSTTTTITSPLPNGISARKPSRNPYGLTPGLTPFPTWPHPTPTECEEIHTLLARLHGPVTAPNTLPTPSLKISGCGEVPSILDALIRTLLSGATSGNNSALAFQGLVRKFGIVEREGVVGHGSVDWDKVRRAEVEEVYEAVKSGGLARAKSMYIKRILDMVYEQNVTRRKGGSGGAVVKAEEEGADDDDEHVLLSLNHLHALSKEDALMEFIKFPGIGVKTAACVVLFCLQRPCFAVDTHVFRICKWLGWLPPAEGETETESEVETLVEAKKSKKKTKKAKTKTRVNEITAFSHLEMRVPDHLKYALHQLFIFHGKNCPRCRAITGENSEGWEKGCVIDHLVKRTGKRKGVAGVGEWQAGSRRDGAVDEMFRKAREKGVKKT
ncbi:hypothetical protein AJ80_06606 [Polytolypa hystricis UAMH7299]|uniref:HhH-GPD domain-containing protein n=1 Tax=Polytolypa hystricis (strain UAMH7299) TaxID=1447883 RepID=A0A2B7XVY0_POLH7|nr:hypothetical protein AJ80_06606 [Polytolypa hystricis UAMH7299]